MPIQGMLAFLAGRVSRKTEHWFCDQNGRETFYHGDIMAAEIRLFPCLSDNFGYLVHDPATKATASIDAPEAAPIIKALEREGWTLTDILITHHHGDHVGGVA